MSGQGGRVGPGVHRWFWSGKQEGGSMGEKGRGKRWARGEWEDGAGPGDQGSIGGSGLGRQGGSGGGGGGYGVKHASDKRGKGGEQAILHGRSWRSGLGMQEKGSMGKQGRGGWDYGAGPGPEEHRGSGQGR